MHIKRQAFIRVMGSANTSTSPIDIFMGTEPISGFFHYMGQRSLFVINSYLHIKAPLHHLPIWPLPVVFQKRNIS
jgi:hypothetical protein